MIGSTVWPLFITCLVLLPSPCVGRGKGPIGIWAGDDDFMIVGDSSLEGVIVVSLAEGRAVERYDMTDMGASVGGVGSCRQCDFILAPANKGDIYRIQLRHTVGEIIESQRRSLFSPQDPPLSFFRGATASLLNLTFLDDGLAVDSRMMVVTDDGSTAYFTSSDDKRLYQMDMASSPGQYLVSTIFVFPDDGPNPYGISLDENDNFLISMSSHQVYRMTKLGTVLRLYDMVEAGCPNLELEPRLRQVTEFEGHLYIMASQPRYYDAAIWKYSPDTMECEIVVGQTGDNSGWIDGVGTDILFSRPHDFAILPTPIPDGSKTLVITDLDNRALRLVQLPSLASTTVMYDRDRRVEEELRPGAIQSLKSCFDIPLFAGRNATEDNVAFTTSVLGNVSMLRWPKTETRTRTLQQAAFFCDRLGARLCEPSELRRAERPLTANVVSWTSGECGSCWQRNKEAFCLEELTDFRTPDKSHSDKGEFIHSWFSGYALEVGANLVADSTGRSATLCYNATAEPERRASFPCCADCY